MARSTILLAGALALTVLCASHASFAAGTAETAVLVKLSPDTVGLDEQAILDVEVTGSAQDLPNIQMPSLPAFEVYSQGHSSNISVVNGQVSASVTARYLIIPRKAGVYPIEGIAVVSNNHRYVGNPVTLTVLNKGTSTSPKLEQRAADEQGNNRDYFMEAVVDKRNPYVNEQVTLTLRFFIGVQYYSSPELDEPTTTGFWTEVLGNGTPYFQKIGNRNYRVIERKYALFPTQTGNLTIGSSSIATTVAGRAQRRDPFDMFGDLFPQGQKITVRSEPVAIKVRPLPEAGKPDGFTGTIGRFEMKAKPDKVEVEVNQPVTVTFEITGAGNIKSVAEPTIPELADFRVYRASSSEKTANFNDRLGGTKTFEEVFMPKRPGILEIPAVSMSFFDPDKGRYETLTSRAMSINVKKPEGYIASADVPYAAAGMKIGSQSQDIRYIKDDIGNLAPVGRLVIFSPLYLVVNGLPVVVLVGLVVARRRREKLASDIGYARFRSASRQARKRLAKARSLAKLETAGDYYGELTLAVTAYIADKLNISPHGLTSDGISELLRNKGAAEDLVNNTVQFLRQCDFARFAPASLTQSDIDIALKSAEQIMTRMEEVKFA
jgi:hypothetical protein